ncbi:DUF4258 domain-containing protein [Pelistega sp. NLN82]|uniref:DUF4258 domain-containing protein n=2 Tax=Pelistega ratti TaxID=2652177 RepID=A0A6L9Y5N0_9BURK|nr:DUF4258 domain-containing protein [Pelistega ratti]
MLQGSVGAVGAVVGETTAHIIADKLYQKSPEALTEQEKETISVLSQVVAGLSGVAVGDNFQSAVVSSEIGKRAVENNAVGVSYTQWKKEEKLRKENPEAYAKLREEQFNLFTDALGIAVDFTPVLGDTKSFVEAEDSIDYILATVGIISGAEVVTKPLREVKVAYQNARKAAQVGDKLEAEKQLNIATEILEKSCSEYTKPLGSRYNQMNQPKNPNYQPVRNNADTIFEREYSSHALDRMQDRGIMPSVIENTIKNGK